MGREFEGLAAFILLLLGAAAVIKILDDATKQTKYKCPRCGGEIYRNQNPCPHCRAPVRWV